MDIIHRATNNEEICKIVPNCKFFLYSDLYKVKTIDELLPKSIVLYQTAKVGHWIGVFKNSEGINVFDSLGYLPDDELKNLPRSMKERLHQDYTYLTRLLYNSNRKIIVNDVRLQSKGTSTCGMHVAYRLLHSDMLNDDYVRMMMKIKNKDLFVANEFMKYLK